MVRHAALASSLAALSVPLLAYGCAGASAPPRTDATPPVAVVSAAPAASAPLPSPLVVAAASAAPPAAPSAAPQPVERGDHAFAARLYGTQRDKAGNVALSPASARVALGMALVGAKGKTATQMADVLGFEHDLDKTTTELSATIARWNDTSDPKVTVRVANAAWGERTLPWVRGYVDTLDKRFRSPLQLVDFQKRHEPARVTINGWVAERTQRRITGLLEESDVSPLTRLALVNATYFKGDWTHAFKRGDTADSAFHAAPDRDVTRPLMHQRAHFGYGETDDAKVLSMPFGKEKWSMVLVLPKVKFGLAGVEAKLTGATIDGWFSSLRAQEVIVTIPRLEATTRMSLGDSLTALGMRDAFAPKDADFTGIAPHQSDDDNLYVAKVIQKVFVKIDETGTEAAAATGVMMAVPTSVPPPAAVFEATQPFVWMIRDEGGNVLFMGRVVEP